MKYLKLPLVLFLLLTFFAMVSAQTTIFTYQGSLSDGANPANGNYDMDFRLFNSASGGSQQGATVTANNVAVANGIFSVTLDFGTQFSGANRFLEIRVRNAGGGSFTTLAPRQPVSSSPYSIKSLTSETAATATNASQLDGVPANQYLQQNGNGAGLTDLNAGNIATGTLSNSRLGQIPTGNIANSAVTAEKIAGGEVVKGINSLKDNVTLAAGSNITITPSGNTLTIASTGGGGNPILNQTNQQAGANFNISGNGTASTFTATTQYNIGGDRMLANSGTGNLFAGVSSGQANTTGDVNAFFGHSTGSANTTGGNNSFFGYRAGANNTTGNGNSFVGTYAGQNNSTAFDNSFFGRSAGSSNTTGSFNSFFGRSAGSFNTTGNSNAFFGYFAGQKNTTGAANSFFGISAGENNTTGSSNAFFGLSAGNTITTGGNNTIIGANADASTDNLSNATALGNGATVNASNKVRLGNTSVSVIEGQVAYTFSSDKNLKENFLNVNGQDVLRKIRSFNITSWNYIGQDPNQFRHYGPMAQDFYSAFGRDSIGSVGSPTTINSGDMAGITLAAIKELSTENEAMKTQINELKALVSYKENIRPMSSGLNLVQKLRPVKFEWKGRTETDLGLVAEEVAAIDPLLVTYNRQGEIRGVKYDRLSVAFVNAFKEQQEQIEIQQRKLDAQNLVLDDQQNEIKLLKAHICSQSPEAEFCKPRN